MLITPYGSSGLNCCSKQYLTKIEKEIDITLKVIQTSGNSKFSHWERGCSGKELVMACLEHNITISLSMLAT